MSWITFSPLAERVYARAALFQQEAFTTNWSSHAEIAESKWLGTQYTKTDNSSFLGDGLVTWEESSEQTSAHARNVRDEDAPEGSRPGTVQRAFRFPAPLKNISAFLALLLCVGLLNASLMRRTKLKREEYDRMQQARTRLEKVKALFPATKRLALVVNSVESHVLLKKVANILAENDMASPATTRAEKFEAFLANALKAIRKLQRIAIKEAAVVMQADKSHVDFSTLALVSEHSTDVLFRLEQCSEELTVQPLVRTYRSLLDSADTLNKQYRDSAKRLFSQRLFQNEGDIDVLVEIAASFEALRDVGSSRRRLYALGLETEKNVLEAVKMMFLARRNHALRDVEGDLQMLRLRCSLAKRAEEAGADSAAAGTQIPDQGQISWAAMEKVAQQVEWLLAELRLGAETLRASTTLAATTAANRHSFKIEEKARVLLEQCERMEALLPSIPEHIDVETRVLLQEMATNNVETVRSESTKLLEELSKLRTTIGREGRWFMLPEPLNKSIAKNLVQQANVIVSMATERAKHTAKVGINLGNEETAKRAFEKLLKCGVDVVFQTQDSGRMATLKLCSRLVVLLEEDIEYIVLQAGKAESQSSLLFGKQKQQYEDLRRKYDEAKKAVVDAQDPSEAADAVANMRECVFKMRGLLYAPGGEN